MHISLTLIFVLIKRLEDSISLHWTAYTMMRSEEATRTLAIIHGNQLPCLVIWCNNQCMTPFMPPTWLQLHIQSRWQQWPISSRLLCSSSSNSSSRWWWRPPHNSSLQTHSAITEPLYTLTAQVCRFKRTIRIQEALCRCVAWRTRFISWSKGEKRTVKLCHLWIFSLGNAWRKGNCVPYVVNVS